ncbi:hypothetical protein AMAG_07917 [Allomyces macrogynus ATCC 38327]|uniref:RRM domain-containing protein n=1 Tax=Allomyces macrogynus (strain ATCC 38327) TaxID=578462 RepID=A0A0L0SJS3_ALLM3|nr:hypothetical protein AMAG_07917 [Allomyces macrogynus ATCC 38327]|eukprot:KNE62731.1 hypothetical protein AMAG_07917 [Allomyces macrogynus ATCC 38327]
MTDDRKRLRDDVTTPIIPPHRSTATARADPAPRPPIRRLPDLCCSIIFCVFAFVEFEDARDAEDAYNDLHGIRFEGSTLSLQWARTVGRREERGRYGGPSSYGGAPRGRSRSPPRRRSRSPLPPRDRSRSPRGAPADRPRSPMRDGERTPPPRSPPRQRSRSPAGAAPRSRSRSPVPTAPQEAPQN